MPDLRLTPDYHAAAALHRALQRRHRADPSHASDTLAATVNLAERLVRTHRLLGLAHRDLGQHFRGQGFRGQNVPGAAERLRRRALVLLDQLTAEASPCLQRLRVPPPLLPSLRQLMDELNQADEEFGGWHYEPAAGRLSVVTPPIELGDDLVPLGRFRVVLELNRFADRWSPLPLRIEALDPNPASSGDQVTHPHVSDEHLCAGDASVPLTRALDAGRVADVFLLVRSVLQTYNPSSPYVALDDWDGRRCHDCDATVPGDDTCWCERCEHEFCDDCFGRCRGCDHACCYGCLERCVHCDQHACDDCIARCDACGRRCCADCLDGDAGECPDCFDFSMEPDDEDHPTPRLDQQAEPRDAVHAGSADPARPREAAYEPFP